jgi:hypothetical protein
MLVPRILTSDSVGILGTDQFGAGLNVASTASIGFSDSSAAYQAGSPRLFKDAPGILAQRNARAPQMLRVYGDYIDTNNYERASLGYSSNQISVGSDVAGSGVHRKLNILGAGIDFYHAGIGLRWSINTNGHFLAATDNVFDIGASGANRPRSIYVGTDLTVGTSIGLSSIDNGLLNFRNRANIASPAFGILTLYDNARTDFNLLQFGGAAGFPGLHRVGSELQVVVGSTAAAINVAAVDADMTFIQDRFRRKGAGTPEGAVTAPVGAVYHRTDGGLLTSFYVKESSPTPNTGWVGK